MPVYEYQGINQSGRRVSGVVDADNPRGLRALLGKDGIYLSQYNEAGGGKKKVRGVEQKTASRDIDVKDMLTRIKLLDVSEMTRQLATLIRAGIPLVESLTAIVEQTENTKLKRILSQIRNSVNEGLSLAQSFGQHPEVFPDLYVNMVRAGESSGTLEIVLARLADFSEAQVKLRSKVTGALMYPAIMMCIAVIIVFAMMIFVIPRITEMFAELGADLPLSTKILIAASTFTGKFWWLIILAFGGSVYAFLRWKETPEGAMAWDRFVLKVPVFGDLTRKIAISRFARTLGTLLASGVPLLTALDIVKNVVANKVLAEVIESARVAIREGESIAAPLKRSKQFPPMVTHMIAIGEKSGELEGMLVNVSESYESQVESRVGALTSILEPIIIVGMGIMVAFLVMSILLPMLKLNQAIRGGGAGMG